MEGVAAVGVRLEEHRGRCGRPPRQGATRADRAEKPCLRHPWGTLGFFPAASLRRGTRRRGQGRVRRRQLVSRSPLVTACAFIITMRFVFYYYLQGSWHYGIRGIKGRLLYDRRKDALEWINKFGYMSSIEGNGEEKFGVFTVVDVEDATLMRSRFDQYICSRCALTHVYYGAFQQIQWRSWVDVPNPFDLTDFSWRLLLDFYSDGPQVKETLAVDLMEGTIVDPIQVCRELLRNEECLVVIHGECYKEDWDSIKDTFFSEHTQSIIVVNSFVESFNSYCKPKVLRLASTQQTSTDTYAKV